MEEWWRGSGGGVVVEWRWVVGWASGVWSGGVVVCVVCGVWWGWGL